jgi:CubicO group peptidase (beta-lactamase class C family)
MTKLSTGLHAMLSAVLLVVGSEPGVAQRPEKPGPTLPTERAGPTGPAPVAARLTRADVEAWLDGLMPYALQRGGIPGAVVVVVKDGSVLFQKGYGYAEVKHRVPVDPERTLFRPGSISKLFTWTAVLQLVEQGKLDLDADINRYLDFRIPPAFGKPITLRDCMTHTPGFEEVGKISFPTTLPG